MNKLDELVKRITAERKVIFLTKYGSHLYGTNTPESDLDLKGVFLPTRKEILLGKIPQTISFDSKTSEKGEKNTKDDIDCQLYSWPYFLHLAGSGQSVAIEMLSANLRHPVNDPVLLESWEWTKLADNRSHFITKEMKAFVGFARSQAIKYSIKGDKLNTAKAFIVFLKKYLGPNGQHEPITKIYDLIEDEYKGDPNVNFLPKTDSSGVRIVEVCGRGLQETFSAKYCIGILENVVTKYGVRAHLASTEGADFKALSHAIRIAMQLFELYEYGIITFPLKYSQYLLTIKRGTLEYQDVMNELEYHIKELEKISKDKNQWPEKIEKEMIDRLTIEMHERILMA